MTICGVRFACVSEARQIEPDIRHHRACENSPCAVRKLQLWLHLVVVVCRRRHAFTERTHAPDRGDTLQRSSKNKRCRNMRSAERNCSVVRTLLKPTPQAYGSRHCGQHQSTVAFGRAFDALNFSTSVCVEPAKLPAGTFQDVDHCGGHDGVALATEMRAE